MFRVVFALVSVLWALAIATDATNNSSTSTDKPVIKATTIHNSVASTSVSQKNDTITVASKNKGKTSHFETDSSMIQRALYVLIGITIIGVLYFLVRAVRLKKTSVAQRKKRYGLLSNYDEDEEDDEDDVVYEARSLRR